MSFERGAPQAVEARETVDFTSVVSHALMRCFDARAALLPGTPRLLMEELAQRYQVCVESLYVLVSPLFPGDVLGEARARLRSARRSVSRGEAPRVADLDAALRSIVSALRAAGLLLREARLGIGVASIDAGGADKAGV